MSGMLESTALRPIHLLADKLLEAVVTSPNSAGHFPTRRWRKSRALPYQGESVRSRNQRQHGTALRQIHSGTPSAPAR